MLWRHRCLVRAGLAAGLVSGLMYIGASIATAQTPPKPALDAEPSSAPVGVVTETVDVLGASKAGDLDVVARGHGQDRVQLTIRNRSTRRLNVVIPPGLVAASTVGQPGGGGAGAGRLQSMGLGSVSNRDGAFGEFRPTAPAAGLQSVDAVEAVHGRQVTVPVGETIELLVPGVCLNYGLPTPTPRNVFRLMDVSEYSTNPLVQKALRSLATYGTSHGVAQAVMWRVCNDLPFETMAEQTGKVMNVHEIALASRFVEALATSGDGELIDPAALSQSRIFVQIRGEGSLDSDASRLASQLEGLRLFGLPLQVVTTDELPAAAAPALFLHVMLTDAKTGETRGRIAVNSCCAGRRVAPAGQGRIPRQFLDLGARRTRARQGPRPRDRRCLCHRQARAANPGQHDLEGREPTPVHRYESGRQGRRVIGVASGAV